MATDGTAASGDNINNGVETMGDVVVEQDTQTQAGDTTVIVDPLSAMQAALASFDGLRVDAAIQVR